MTQPVSAMLGAFIVVGIRWFDRLVGLVSTMVLARLLVPDDFGIIAMASLVIGLIDVLLDLGVHVALVQNSQADQDDYDAAWTLRLLQSGLAAGLILLASYPAADYFHDARVTRVIQALALSVLLQGLENIGMVAFQKQMAFGQEFRFFFGKRISGFAVTLLAAWWLHSYWALVIGTLVGRLVGVLLSYAMHPMRPRPSLKRMRAMLSFSSWNLLRGIGDYLAENLHRLLVGERESAALMGAYTLASDVAAMPSTELLAPLNRVLFPMFVRVKDDAGKLKDMFLLAVGVQALLGVPAGAGLALVAPELVLALLGEKWLAAVPFVQIMGAVNIVSALRASGTYVLLAAGRTRWTALHSWSQVLLFLALAVWLIPTGGAMVIAELRLALAGVSLLTFLVMLRWAYPDWALAEMLASVWRPCAAAGVMALVLLGVPLVVGASVLLTLLLKTLAGAAVYGLALLALWRAVGKPPGAEAYLLSKLQRR